MKDKPERKYYMINDEDVQFARKSRGGFPIKGQSKHHIFTFFPDGSVQVKEDMCSCTRCRGRR